MKVRKVSFVAFQTALQAPGVLTGEKTISAAKQKGADVELHPGIILIKWKNKEIAVPLTNVISMLLVNEDAA